jgi:8-oxo-dGTP pyrophosphatase MutT (NUDIX family)
MKFEQYMDTNFLGAGIVFRTGDNKILILQKPNGKWSFPGGHREKGETPIQTAKRECIEEIGQMPNGIIVYAISYIKNGDEKHCYSFIMDIEKEFEPILSFEHKDYKWVKPKKINDMNLSGGVKDLWSDLRKYLI